jgi:hypothetical protein
LKKIFPYEHQVRSKQIRWLMPEDENL